MRRALLILSVLLSVSVTRTFAVYVYANTQTSGSNGSCVGCSITNPQNSVTTDTTDYARLNMTVSTAGAQVWQRLQFPAVVSAGTYVRVIVEDVSGQALTPLLLSNVRLTSYMGSVSNIDTRNSTQYTIQNYYGSRYFIGFTPALSFNAIEVQITPLQASMLSSLKVYAAFYDSNPLPIELLYFNASSNDDKVKLDWATATEINNNYFTVERSADGNAFDAIGRVDGAGSSTTVNYYSYEDAPFTVGTLYYRIMQTDYDGKFSYSPVVAVEGNDDAKGFSIYPNPYNGGELFIAAQLDSPDEDGYISIYSLNGSLVYREDVQAGNSCLRKKLQPVALQPGMYTLVVTSGAHARSQRLVIP